MTVFRDMIGTITLVTIFIQISTVTNNIVSFNIRHRDFLLLSSLLE